MAKLTDKFYVRIIEGQLELDPSEQAKQDASAVKAVEGASAGTIDKPLGLSSQGKLVKGDFPSELPAVAGNEGKVLKVNSGATGVEWGSVSGGTQLYKHTIKYNNGIADNYYYIISTGNTPLTAHPVSSIPDSLGTIVAKFMGNNQLVILSFYADDTDYNEYAYAVSVNASLITSANLPNAVLQKIKIGTFISDTVTPL